MTQRFQSPEHAFVTGAVVGAIVKAGKELWGDDFTVLPEVDTDGDYQQQVHVQVAGRRFLIDVTEMVIEENPAGL